MPHSTRIVLMVLAGLSLLAALWTGLARIGWDLPLPNADFVSLHGPLMVIGFLGTLIGLERAAAAESFWVYAIPVFSALSILALLCGATQETVALLALIAALLFTVFFAGLYRRQPSEPFVVMTLSAAALSVANMVWVAETPVPQVVPWWVGFLVLMIAGERLELTRVRQPPLSARMQFRCSVAILLLGLIVSVFAFFAGVRVAGAGLLALACWLLRYDLAWQSLRLSGMPRFMASCLIAGYIWLAAGGLLWLLFSGSFVAGALYDAMLHAIFLGFVFSMIFAHGPIILPVITGVKMAFLKSFYLHATLLHAALVLRVYGDLGFVTAAQKWGGALNALAIILFLGNNIRAVKVANAARPAAPPAPSR